MKLMNISRRLLSSLLTVGCAGGAFGCSADATENYLTENYLIEGDVTKEYLTKDYQKRLADQVTPVSGEVTSWTRSNSIDEP